MSNGVNRGSSSCEGRMNSVWSAVGVCGIERSPHGIWAGVGGLWILVGDGGGEDLGLKISLQVVKAKRKGDGVTVLRGYFKVSPSFRRVSRPAEAGDGGEPEVDDKSDDNVFRGDAILLNFRPCTGGIGSCC